MAFRECSTGASFEVTLKAMSFLLISEIDGDIYGPWASFGCSFTFARIVFSEAVFHVAAKTDVNSAGAFLASK